MAVVPTLRPQVQERAPFQTLPNARATPEALGAGIGRAFGVLGQGVQEIAVTMDARKALDDEEAVTGRMRELLQRQRDILNNPDTGALAQTGFNAGGPLPVEGLLRDEVQRLSEGLSPEAARIFAQRAEQVVQTSANQVSTNHRVQQRAAIVDNSQAAVQLRLQSAVDAASNPAVFEERLAAAIAEQNRLDAMQGVGAETRAANAKKITSTALRGVAVQIALNDPVRAAEFIQENRDRFEPADRVALETNLEQAVRDFKAAKLVDDTIAANTGTNSAANTRGLPFAVARSEGTGKNPFPGQSAVGYGQVTNGTLPHVLVDALVLGPSVGITKDEIRRIGGFTQEDLKRLRVSKNPEDAALYRKMVDAYAEGRKIKLREAGFPVNDVNFKIIWQFGDAGGLRFLRAVRDMTPQQLASINAREFFGDRVVDANPELQVKGTGAPKSLAGVYATKEAEIRRAGGSVDINFEAVQTAINQIDDPRDRAAAQKAFEDRLRLQNLAQEQRGEALFRDTMRRIDEEGFNPNSMNAEDRISMGVGRFAQVLGVFDQIQTGNDITNTDTLLRLEDAAANDREAFLAEDLSVFRDQLSVQDYRSLRDLQSQLRAEDSDPFSLVGDPAKLVTDDPRVFGAFIRSTGKDFTELKDREQKELQNRFTLALMRRLQAIAQEQGSPATLKQAIEVAEALGNTRLRIVPKTAVGQFFSEGEERPGFDLSSIDPNSEVRREAVLKQIPRETVVRVSNVLGLMFGSPPDEEEALDVIGALSSVRLGEEDSLTIEDVPDRFVQFARERVPEASDEELVDFFVDWLRKRDDEGLFP